MFTERLRRVSYGWLVLQGLAATVAPKQSIDLNVKLWGFPFENTGELEPRDWYVRTVRAAGLGMLTAGVAGLVLEGRAGESDGEETDDTESADADDTESADADDTESADADDTDDSPADGDA